MSKIAAQLFEGLKRVGEEVGAEASRLGRQGASELAAAIFSGSGYVMYGPNQPGQNQEKQPEIEQQQETGIER